MANYYTGAPPRASGARIGAAPEDAAAAAAAAAAIIASVSVVLDPNVEACVMALSMMLEDVVNSPEIAEDAWACAAEDVTARAVRAAARAGFAPSAAESQLLSARALLLALGAAASLNAARASPADAAAPALAACRALAAAAALAATVPRRSLTEAAAAAAAPARRDALVVAQQLAAHAAGLAHLVVLGTPRPSLRAAPLEAYRGAFGAVAGAVACAERALRASPAAPAAAAPAVRVGSAAIAGVPLSWMRDAAERLWDFELTRFSDDASREAWRAELAPAWRGAVATLLTAAGLAARRAEWADAFACAIREDRALDALVYCSWNMALETSRNAASERLELETLRLALEAGCELVSQRWRRQAAGRENFGAYESAAAFAEMGAALLPRLARGEGFALADGGAPEALLLPLAAVVAGAAADAHAFELFKRVAQEDARRAGRARPLAHLSAGATDALCLGCDFITLRCALPLGEADAPAAVRAGEQVQALAELYAGTVKALHAGRGAEILQGDWANAVRAADGANLAVAALAARRSAGCLPEAEEAATTDAQLVYARMLLSNTMQRLEPRARGAWRREECVRALARLAESEARVLLALPRAAADAGRALLHGAESLAAPAAFSAGALSQYLFGLKLLLARAPTLAERRDGSFDRASARARAAAEVCLAGLERAARELAAAPELRLDDAQSVFAAYGALAGLPAAPKLRPDGLGPLVARFARLLRAGVPAEDARLVAGTANTLGSALALLSQAPALRYAPLAAAAMELAVELSPAGPRSQALNDAVASLRTAVVFLTGQLLKAALARGAPVGPALQRFDAAVAAGGSLDGRIAGVAEVWRSAAGAVERCARAWAAAGGDRPAQLLDARASMLRWCSSALCTAPLLSSQRGLADGRGLKWRRRCRGCRTVAYCSEECAAADWRGGHKDVCAALAAGG